MKQRIRTEAAALAVVENIIADSAETCARLQQTILREELTPGIIPSLPDSAGREFCIMLCMLENEGLSNHFGEALVERLREVSTRHMAIRLDLSREDLSRWYLQYAEPYRFDLSVPTDPFTPFGFLGVFGRRVGLPSHRVSGISHDLYINPLGATLIAAALLESAGLWKKVKEHYEIDL